MPAGLPACGTGECHRPGVKLQCRQASGGLLGELVVTCIVRHQGATVEADAVRSVAKEQLASYKIPRRVLFFREEEYALTGNEKVKASELRDKAVQRLAAEERGSV